MSVKTTKYRCLNCPSKPVFLDLDDLKSHWKNTHVVPMEHTVLELMQLPAMVLALAPDLSSKTIKLWETVTS